MNRRPSAPASQAMQLRRGVLYPTAFLTPDAPIPRDTTDDDPLMADLPMLSVRAAAPGIHTSLLRAPPPGVDGLLVLIVDRAPLLRNFSCRFRQTTIGCCCCAVGGACHVDGLDLRRESTVTAARGTRS